MAINYQLRKQRLNLNGKPKDVIVTSTIHKGVATLEEIETMVAKISAASEGDVRSIIRTMSELISQNLSQGRIVELGDLGRFRVSVKCKSADSTENFSSDNIKGLKVLYYPGKLIRKMKKGARIEHNPVKDHEKALKEVSLPQP